MLGARCHRPHGRAAEQRNELAPLHSIQPKMFIRAGYQFSNHAPLLRRNAGSRPKSPPGQQEACRSPRRHGESNTVTGRDSLGDPNGERVPATDPYTATKLLGEKPPVFSRPLAEPKAQP